MLRRIQRAIGSVNVVTVDFNPRKKNKLLVWSSIGTMHIILSKMTIKCPEPTALKSFFNVFFRGLKSTVTKSVKPTALLSTIT